MCIRDSSNRFYDELGERLSPELRDIYLWASQGANQMKESLRQIQQDLGEITRDARPIHGAYYCEYEMFKSVYQMVARRYFDRSLVLQVDHNC